MTQQGVASALAGSGAISVQLVSARWALISEVGSALRGAQGVQLVGARVATNEDLAVLLGERSADVIMVDTELIAGIGAACLELIHRINPGASLVLVWDDAYPLAADEITKQPIRGCIPLKASPEHYVRAIRDVSQGTLWLPRWIMADAFKQRLLAAEAQGGTDRQPPPDVAHPALTAREELIARLAAHGQTNKEIAKDLNVSPDTIKKHLKAVFGKLRVHRRGQLAFCLPVAREEPLD